MSNSDDYHLSSSNLISGQEFWNNQYLNNNTGWDLGEVSPPLKEYFDQLTDKNIRILIPGCGNTYEADYLLNKGFTNITIIDIAPALIEKLIHKYESIENIQIILGDFFNHQGEYDLIIEQTFFCALDPSLRKNYVTKVKELLAPSGKLSGLLFDRVFEKQGPPFGGLKNDYITLFENDFNFKHFEKCYNSYHKRAETELFITLTKK